MGATRFPAASTMDGSKENEETTSSAAPHSSLRAKTGIVGRQGCVFSIIEDNHIHNINNMQELAGAEIAGIKFHAAIDVIFRRNHIHNCTMGIWCDWEAQGNENYPEPAA